MQLSNNIPQKKPAAQPKAYAPERYEDGCWSEDEEEDIIYADDDPNELFRDLRGLQQRTNCSNTTCLEFIKLYNKHVDEDGNLPKTFAACDKELKEAAGATFLELHGCTECNGFVFTPQDKRDACPCCGHARYDSNGKPNERVFYFPIKERLQKLMGVETYRQMLQHEFERPRHDDYMTDVYDAPAWQEFMGPPVFPNARIGLQFCVDGIPAFAAGTLSLKPAEFINMSLPPAVRNKSENILLLMLLPNSLPKGRSQKKYYDFAATFELNELARDGDR